MTTTISPASTTTVRASENTTASLLRSIALAGLVIGTLGGIDYLVFFRLTQHEGPVQVYQYIASGLLGPAAFAQGYTSALLGVLIHYFISFAVAAVFILAARWIALVRRTVFVSAFVYGAAVSMFMSMFVLPMSAAPKMPASTVLIVHGLVSAAVFVGLPLAIIVWRSARTASATATA